MGNAEKSKKCQDSHLKVKTDDFEPQSNTSRVKKHYVNQSDQEIEERKEKNKENMRVRYENDDNFKLKKKNEYEENKPKIIENQKKRREAHKNNPQNKIDQAVIDRHRELDEVQQNRYNDPKGFEEYWQKAMDDTHAEAERRWEENKDDPEYIHLDMSLMDETYWRKPDFKVPKVERDPNVAKDTHYRFIGHNKVPAKLDDDGPEVEDFTDAEKEQLLYETNFVLHKFNNVFKPSLKFTNAQWLDKNHDLRDICYCCQNLYLFSYTVEAYT